MPITPTKSTTSNVSTSAPSATTAPSAATAPSTTSAPTAPSAAPHSTVATAAAQTARSTFRQSTSVRCEIAATPEVIWALLTDAARIPTWNSTVTSIEGSIELGARLALKVPLAPTRTFKPKVTHFAAGEQMIWSEGFAPMFRGVRTFTLTPTARGTTEFAMTEVLSGAMIPMIRKTLPDFAPAFTTYAADLKRAAEAAR